jgi:hypothetical protein
MKREHLKEAVLEATKFINRAKKFKFDEWENSEYGKCSAACKRTSLDLTMVLAKLRK